MKIEKITELMPVKYMHNILHMKQRYNWDCGITCVLMLLSEEDKKEFLCCFGEICQQEGFSQSTWTIDLCYLLKRYNIEHCMYTTRQSPNKRSLNNISSNTNEIVNRICKKFANASINGIRVFDGVLSMKQIFLHIMNKGPAILLVNAALLSCDICKHNKLTSEFRRIFGGSYRGHYIVVIGWSGGKLVYRDPARASALCAATPGRLHAARLTPGTDCDVILIYNHCR